MDIAQIREEIPKAFGRLFTVSKVWLENNDVDTRDFEVEDYYKTAARMLVDWAYESGKAEAKNHGDSEIDEASYDVGYSFGFEAAAKDPKAWYVLDKNGEEVHIDDWGNSYDWCGDEETLVIGLGDGEIIGSCMGNLTIQSNEFEKVTPDSWEELRDEIQELFYQNIDVFDEYGEERGKSDRCAEAETRANEIIDRAKKLAEVD